MKNNQIIIPVVLSVVTGLGLGFFGGMQFRNYQIGMMRGNFPGGQRFAGTNLQGIARGRMMGGQVFGSILSVDKGTVTVKLNDGSSKIVVLSGTTTYSNTVTATQSDLKVGSTIGVFGTPNSDGSVTATNVQLNPSFVRMGVTPAPVAK